MKLNTASDYTKKLIDLLVQLEGLERDKMSNDGKMLFDKIWTHLRLPTYDQIQNYDDVTAADFDENGALNEEE
tara:strand:- start:2735 stop:2953 length:219 start_codon:yes stop_codon:yes gene_type:complete